MALASKNNDRVESSFAAYDHSGKVLNNVSVSTIIAVAQARMLKLFDGIGSKRQRALSIFNRKRTRGEFEAADEAQEVAKQLATWEHTSFFKLPEEVQRKIIKDLQHRYTDICVTRPRLALLAHDRAKVQRLQDARQTEITKQLNRALNFQKYCAVLLVTDVQGLTALTLAHAENKKTYAEALRDQLRARIHAHGVLSKDLPAIKHGHDPAEIKRSEDGIRATFGTVIPALLPRIAPYPVRPAGVGYRSPEALAVDLEHMKAIAKAWVELNAMTELGVFKARRATSKNHPRRHATAKSVGTRPAPAKRTALADRAVRAVDLALIGATFEEDGVDWMVLSVEWSVTHNRVMVWYFDVDGAEAEGLTKETMHAARAANTDLDPLECSTVVEIRAWITSSAADT